MESVSTYTGEKVEITYDRRRCIHAGECGRGSRALFDAKQDPWCDPDAVGVEEAIAVVARCPSGALQIKRLDGGKLPPPAIAGNVITVSPDGPLYAQGELAIEGTPTPAGRRLALCRCGASKHKPVCDGSHAKVGFKDAGPINSDPEPGELGTGKLEVIPAKDGPLVINGPLRLVAASGREAFRGTKTALCRCGSSANKPFCDGSHKRVGFTSG